MSPRTGRPTIGGERLDVDVKVRLDKTTNELLLEYCKKNGITRTEAIRRGVHLLIGQTKKE